MAFLTRLNPAGGIADFWHEFRRPNPYRWPILIISALITFLLIWAFARDQYYLPPEKPQVTFINTFPEGRSVAEIRASNLANQQRKARAQAEQAARDEAAKDAYRQLGRASGMDVDAIERRIAADKAAEEAAKAKRLKAYVAPGTPAQGAAVAE